jgi:prolyl-tRNA editing enzyme YbaK/EbsC (Cys-tRNA(Pro) deacylase)
VYHAVKRLKIRKLAKKWNEEKVNMAEMETVTLELVVLVR